MSDGRTMQAIRLHEPGGIGDLRLEQIDVPRPQAGEALVDVHAAAITRDELEWPLDRLPAIPSYELSGVVTSVAPDVTLVSVGDPVYALTPFDRDGVAAAYAAVPADLLAPSPRTLDHIQSAGVPLPALSAWQGLFVHGVLEPGQRVLIHGASGGVGHLAVQLAHGCGAYVIGTTSPAGMESARGFGADEVLDGTAAGFEDALDPVDLVFDTVGGELLTRSPAMVLPGGRIVTVAEDPPEGVDAISFLVQGDRAQLIQLAELIDGGNLVPAIDSVFALVDASDAFARSMAPGKRGKVVLRVDDT